MKFKVSCVMDAMSANEALSRFHAMLAITGVDVDDVRVKLIGTPTEDDIKFLAEAVENGDEFVKPYPHLDELLEYLTGDDGD